MAKKDPSDIMKKRNQRATTVELGEPLQAADRMPWEFYEGLAETLEILSDNELVEALNASLDRDAKRKTS